MEAVASTGEVKMKQEFTRFTEGYLSALREFLQRRSGLGNARLLGHAALSAGLGTLAVARTHRKALESIADSSSWSLNRRAGDKGALSFFLAVVTPIEKHHERTRKNHALLGKMMKKLDQRTIALAVSNHELKEEIRRRTETEAALREKETHHAELLRKSAQLQERLRLLSHQIISTQEAERKRISRELHDQVAATLCVINAELAALKSDVAHDENLCRRIAQSEEMVQNSVGVIHDFARDLRPPILDDMGLIPAIRSCVEKFSDQTGIPANLRISHQLEFLDSEERTALYRVTQEALSNVAQHANAKEVSINVGVTGGNVSLAIGDDGRSFTEEKLAVAGRSKRLGLLGMRERIEMLGGKFQVEPVPGKGTIVSATLPLKQLQNGRNSNGKGIRSDRSNYYSVGGRSHARA
jgi:signal transduction histidine kinase